MSGRRWPAARRRRRRRTGRTGSIRRTHSTLCPPPPAAALISASAVSSRKSRRPPPDASGGGTLRTAARHPSLSGSHRKFVGVGPTVVIVVPECSAVRRVATPAAPRSTRGTAGGKFLGRCPRAQSRLVWPPASGATTPPPRRSTGASSPNALDGLLAIDQHCLLYTSDA